MSKSNKPICQICGKPIEGKVNLWDGKPELPTHVNMKQCGSPQLFCDFINRNVAYINGRGQLVLLEVA